MTSLKFLAVARNRISRLPIALGDMHSLSKIKIENNPIEFPPPDVITPSHEHDTPTLDIDPDRVQCQKIKAFMRSQRRQRTKINEDDTK